MACRYIGTTPGKLTEGIEMLKIRLLLGFVLVLPCSLGFADAIYRWVDSKGKTHYSQSKPLDHEYTVIDAAPPPPADSPDLNKPYAEQIDAKTKNKAEDVEKTSAAKPEKNDDQCETARNNLSKLQAAVRVGYTNEAGETVYLDDESRATRMAETQKYIEYFCS